MLQDELKEIRTQLRMAMNGVIATSMREKGIDYKLNFGVPLPEIKQIAARHEPGSDLAAALWKEDIREFKILASLLQPVDDFPFKQAEQWVKEIPYLEIAEQLELSENTVRTHLKRAYKILRENLSCLFLDIFF